MSTQDTLVSIYLDYINNFLTIGNFAERCNLTIEEANKLIALGKCVNERLEIKKKLYNT